MSRKMVENYEIDYKQKLGEGGFGCVYIGTNRISNEKYAIKVMNKRALNGDEYRMKSLKSEILLLHKIKSDHVVGLKDAIETRRNYYIIQELCDCDLKYALKKEKIFSQQRALDTMRQVLTGFAKLITEGYVHRDLKPENILIKDGVVKICDFGLCCQYSHDSMLSTSVGTLSYQAPQVLFNDRYTYKCDIWAFGLIFYELLYGKLPFKASSIQGLIKLYRSEISVKFPPEPPVKEQIKKMIQRCLIVDEEERADWEQIFNHPLFQGRLPEINSFKQKLNYLVVKFRQYLQESNIDLSALLELFKKNTGSKEIQFNEFYNAIGVLNPQLERSQIHYIFIQFDKNSDGSISWEEFESFLRENKINFKPIKREQLKKDIIECEGQETDQAEQHEEKKMEQLYEKLIQHAVTKEINNFRELYLKMNKNHKGLNKQEFSLLLCEMCPQLEAEDCQLIFHKFDENKDGIISYEQFYKYICKVMGQPSADLYVK